MTGGRRTSGILMLVSAIYSFVATSITQVPSFFSVISWHLSHRIWLPLLFLFLEAGVLAGGYGLKKLEENLSKPKKRRRR